MRKHLSQNHGKQNTAARNFGLKKHKINKGQDSSCPAAKVGNCGHCFIQKFAAAPLIYEIKEPDIQLQ